MAAAATAAAAIPNGPVIIFAIPENPEAPISLVIAPPTFPKFEITVLIPVEIFPNPIKTGPTDAATAANFTTVF